MRKTEVLCSPCFLTIRNTPGLSEQSPGTLPGPSQTLLGYSLEGLRTLSRRSWDSRNAVLGLVLVLVLVLILVLSIKY